MNQLQVPLLDLTAQYATIEAEIREAIERVTRSQRFILGPEVEALEKGIADYCGARFAIGVTSGTDALLMVLMALGIGPGDEVITSPYSFFATAGSIARVGARPVFVDIDPLTYNLDTSLIAAKVTPRTKAIMPVHLYGQCVDMGELLEVASRHGLFVIEDACQAIGAEHNGRRAGSMGDAGCFSFFPSKNLGGFGDGGAVTTNDSVLAERLRCLRNHGMEPKYYHKMIGGNFRLDALQAAVLNVKLKHLDVWTERRRRNAVFYDGAFGDIGMAGSLVVTPAVVAGRHIFNQYVIRVADRDAVRAHLDKEGVGTEIYYPVPLHLQPCFDYLGGKRGDCPESEEAAAATLALPIYPELTSGKLQKVVDSIAGYFQAAGRFSQRRAA